MSRHLSFTRPVMVAMLGAAALALAGTRDARGTKLVPLVEEKTARGSAPAPVADGPRVNRPAVAAAPHTPVAPLAPLSAPANDLCAGAIAIPDGPFPLATAPVDITEATPQDVDEGLHPCGLNGLGADRTIWYSFTPSVSAAYVISTCAGGGAIGSTVYDTVLSVFDSTAGSCPESGGPLSCADGDLGCTTTLPGAPYIDQSTLTVALTAGTTYFIVAGHWYPDTDGVAPGFNQIALTIDISPAPDNDTCASPTPLTLDQLTTGTTLSAHHDYKSIADGTCFSGVGQLPTTSNGLDVVFSFTPPTSDTYSFRYVQDDAFADLRDQSPVLYLSASCPASAPTGPAVPCIAGANRMDGQATGNGNRSEEIKCVALTGGTPYYLFFDDANDGNDGGPLAVEVTKCVNETEPNGTPATATPFSANASCFMEGSAIPSGPAGDIDFYDLGAPPVGSKVFVGLDTAAANASDYELRITNATDTLGYDDDDGTSWVGSNAPIIAGVIADGSELFARVNAKPVSAGNEPYNIFARIETGVAENESLPDPAPANIPANGTFYGAEHLAGGGYVKGIIYGWDIDNGPTDVDCFRFVAHVGDDIVAFSDNNPSRSAGTITNVWPVILTIDGDPTPANTRFVGQVVRNDVTPSPGTLTGVTPSVTSNFMHYRARYTGAYAICYEPTQDVNAAEIPTPGAYPLPYQGSISLNCGPVPAPTPADVSVTMTKGGPAGPVNTGAVVDYTITLTNHDATGIAQDVRLALTLPAQLVYLGLSVDDGFGGNNTGCLTLPTPGTGDAPIDCTNYSLPAGASITYTLGTQVSNCIGAGQTVDNTASITTFTLDANPANDTATSSFVTTEDGTCQDLLCDATGCITNECTVSDHCVASACVSTPLNCDDNSLCTDDSCDPSNAVSPCVHDATQSGDLCDDGNDCTSNTCDPLLFCVFPPTSVGSVCDDFLNCTNGDACNGSGTCLGHSVCDDGQPCTDDFADETNSCACTNFVTFEGSPCDDGDACTIGTVCDGLGGAAANCGGGTTADCNDNDLCTADSCDAGSGCIHNDASAACNDNNPCTTDTCGALTGCGHTNNTNACDDGDLCTVADACAGGACVGGNAVVCTASDDCHLVGACAPGTGVCTNPAKPAGSSCDDGNICTDGDTCDNAAACVGGPPLDCDDADACTADSCDATSGCVTGLANFDASGFSANRVDGRDLVVFAQAWNSCPGNPFYNAAVNLDQASSGPGLCVDLTDFHLFMNTFGESCP